MLTSTQISSHREFGLVFAAFFCLVGLWPLLSHEAIRMWALGLAGVFAAIAIAMPIMLAPFTKQWLKFGELLHKIVNPLVLGLIFMLAILPIGLLLKTLGKDPLRLKRPTNASSYWIERHTPGPAPDSLPHQF